MLKTDTSRVVTLFAVQYDIHICNSLTSVSHTADSTIGRARIVRGHRIRARNLPGTIHYRFSHYFVRLREGRPPEHYYPRPMTGNEKMADYLKSLRERRVYHSL